MMKLVACSAGFAVGYVLGAKAGEQRYDQIVATVRGLGERLGVLDPHDRPAPTAFPHPETLTDLAASAAATAASTDGM